ncbi:membrane dipeptidase [Carnobacterium iners]|uniref:Membrane dipeptidase n=1 Tax=Carnobacterium iners TaxID=1073423 RepID=A0A1X7N6D3_9LACT|nr:dipeptidase [Carnobacterium iners]SEK60002.1 membrane dipeptidase [Carnobacterium iners]SMH32328.1 membrane dipeptidase [Carnobacterium iners]
MDVIDLHCDTLLKLQQSNGKLDFKGSDELSVNLARLKEGQVKIQAFAIFIEPDILVEEKYAAALEQITYYQQDILGKNPEIKQIKKWDDIKNLKDGEIGSFLTLEGVEAIGNDLTKLDHLLDLGVLSVGLTWNPANLAADGIQEPRGGGLTAFGFDIVAKLNSRKVFTDVSHLSIASFWDVMKVAKYPIATHSNVLDLCGHVRNLNNDQIKAMIERNAPIHIVFNPPFTIGEENQKTTNINDLVKHVEALVELGAMKNIGFGSDFDGISSHIENLTHIGQVQNLVTVLEEIFSKTEVEGFAAKNFLNHLPS